MPRRPTRTVPVVVLHGLNGNSDDHWQTWLAAELKAAGRDVHAPTLPDYDEPQLEPWLTTLRDTIADLPADGYDVVCHSLASLLWLHHANNPGDSPRPARVALVAPPSPVSEVSELAPFLPVPLDTDKVRAAADGTVLVCSDNDPYCPEGAVNAYGRPLKMATTLISGGGHLNVDAGYGPWPAVLDWCGRDNLAFIA